jgi:hypothetical protein
MLYKTLDISNLDQIKEELNNVIQKNSFGFRAGDTNLIKEHCPSLIDYLQKVNLLDRWKDTGVSILTNSYRSLKIHSDSLDPQRIYALNIPVSNCENSYTVWYKANEGVTPIIDKYGEPKKMVYSFQYKSEDVEEIDRMESSNPAFVNVKVPHSGISFNDSVRCLISLRFIPNITEEEIQRVIDLLECEYLDLFLIHHSCGSDHDFEVLKLCQSKGLITYYGVSNYEDITKIRELKEKHDIYANQIQARPPKGKIDGRRDLNPENFIDVCNSLLVKIMLFASISSIINSDEYINFYDHFDKVNKYYIDKYIRDKENVLIVSSLSGGTLDMNL